MISMMILASAHTCYESPPVLYELLDLGFIHSEVPHHHSSVIAKPEYHKALLGVTCESEWGVSGKWVC